VRPGGKRAIDKAAADFLRANIETLGWDTICDKMLMGVFYGFAVGECLWAPDGRYWTLDAIRVRDRRRFGFDGENRLRLKTLQQPLGELLPEKKFWTFAAGADHDDAPYGLGLAHWLYWPVWFKRNGHRFWATFLERFGTPAAVGKYPAATPLADQTKLLEALRALRRDAAVTIPEGIAIELLEATRSGTADYATFVGQMNAAILVAAIGQTASTQGTPGKLGNDDTQNDVRLDIVRADADLLSASFNATVARWLTEWNFPGAAVPGVWRLVEEAEDLKTRAERDKSIFEMGYKPTQRYIEETYGGEWEVVTPPAPPPAGEDKAGKPDSTEKTAAGSAAQKFDAALINAYSMGVDRFARLGIEIPQSHVREVFSLPKPTAGEPILKPAEQKVGAGGTAPAEFAEGEPTADPIDALVDEALAGWQAQIGPLVSPIEALFARAAAEGWTARQLIDALPELLPEMDDAALVDALTQASGVARLAGSHGRDAAQD
jgi:phage gp29-like protein